MRKQLEDDMGVPRTRQELRKYRALLWTFARLDLVEGQNRVLKAQLKEARERSVRHRDEMQALHSSQLKQERIRLKLKFTLRVQQITQHEVDFYSERLAAATQSIRDAYALQAEHTTAALQLQAQTLRIQAQEANAARSAMQRLLVSAMAGTA